MRTVKKGPWARYVELLIQQQFGGNQSELARAVGVTPQTVSRWVGNNESVPRHHVLVKIADAAGRPVAELISVAYGVDPEDAKLKAQVETLVQKVPVTQLDKILDDLEAAKEAKRITVAEYRSAFKAITLAAEAQYYDKVIRKNGGDLPDAAAAVS